MNKLTTIAIGVVAVVALVISVANVNSSPEVISGSVGAQGVQGPKGDVGPRGPQGERGPAGASAVKIGSVASPDIPSPYLTWGGLTTYRANVAFTAATTTVCALQSPVATSTLVSFSASFSVSSSTATVVTLAKAATPYATTTRLAFGSISANAQGTLFANATSTDSSVDPITVFGPSQYAVVGMSGGAGTFSPSGRCTAQWNVVSQ